MSNFSERIALRKDERNIRRNQLEVILIGWGRYRKERHCHSFD